MEDSILLVGKFSINWSAELKKYKSDSQYEPLMKSINQSEKFYRNSKDLGGPKHSLMGRKKLEDVLISIVTIKYTAKNDTITLA